MNIYIYYEHLAREWESIVQLKNRLESKYKCNVFLYSIIFERFKSYKQAKKNKPDVLLVPWFINETHEPLIEPLIKCNPGLKVINLHQEQISSAAFAPVLVPKTVYALNGMYHVTWGDYYKNILIKNGVEEELISVTGNIRNDAGASASASKDALAKEYKLNSKKKWILFAENRGWLLQRNNDAIKMDLIAKGVMREDIDACIEYQQKSLDAFLNHLNSIPDTILNHFEFIYRPHPGTMIDCKNPKVHVISEKSIYKWIHCCDLFITCESTSIYEAEFCNKPCATFDLIDEPKKLKMPGIDEYYRLDTLHNISDDTINQIIEYQIRHPRIYEKYLGKIDGNSVERLSDYIMEICNKSNPTMYNVKKPSFYNIIHGYAFENITRIVVKLGILEKIKFPDSAYVESRDIPFSKTNIIKYKE